MQFVVDESLLDEIVNYIETGFKEQDIQKRSFILLEGLCHCFWKFAVKDNKLAEKYQKKFDEIFDVA